MSLTINEFRKLSQAERGRRYIELSSHDKFIARMEDWGAPDNPPDISEEAFLTNPPKGWECVTKEVLDAIFPDKKD